MSFLKLIQTLRVYQPLESVILYDVMNHDQIQIQTTYSKAFLMRTT